MITHSYVGGSQYDYGARFYDANLGRWVVVDPLSESSPNVSAFSYVSNNPIKLIDPNGMEIYDPNDIVQQYQDYLGQTQNGVRDLLGRGIITNDLYEILNQFINNEMAEIKRLKKSDQLYNLTYDNKGNEGGTSWNRIKGSVEIQIGRNNDNQKQMALIGHELTHGYQYDTGQISFMTDGLRYGSLYDLTDERTAYSKQHILNYGVRSGSITILGTPAIDKNGYPITDYRVSNNDVQNINNSYNDLSTESIDINSSKGKALRAKTIEAGKTSSTVTEVYKGWEKDYQLGAKQKK